MKVTIEKLEWFVKTHNFSDEPIRINQAEVIHNQRQFAESHLAVLLRVKDKSKEEKKVWIPYFNRLSKLYKIIENENKNN